MRKGQWFIVMSVIFLVLLSSVLYYYNTFYDESDNVFMYQSVNFVDGFLKSVNNYAYGNILKDVKNNLYVINSVSKDRGYGFQAWIIVGKREESILNIHTLNYMYDDIVCNISVNGERDYYTLHRYENRTKKANVSGDSLVDFDVRYNYKGDKEVNGTYNFKGDSFIIYYFLFNGTRETYVYQGVNNIRD